MRKQRNMLIHNEIKQKVRFPFSAPGALRKRRTGQNIGLIETGRRNITLNTFEHLCRFYGTTFFKELEI